MSKRALRVFALGGAVLLVGVGAIAVAGADARNFRASPLIGYEEVPAVSTVARGSWVGRLSRDGNSLAYTLRFRGLEGTFTQSHIHFGQRLVAGGISIFFCTNLGNGPVGTQPCPGPGQKGETVVTGTVDADDVVGPSGQGIAAGEWNEIIKAMRTGNAYVNVHSLKIPGGEIRAQIKAVR